MEIAVTEHLVRIVTVAPRGRLDAFTALELRSILDNLGNEGVAHFIVDLSMVEFLDSAGMAALVSALKRARQAGGDVKLVEPGNNAALRILRLTKFDQVFSMSVTADNALAKFLA